MASISHVGPIYHLRAEPNQYILHYRNGKLVRRGAGLAYWFSPFSAAVAQVPVEDCETTFVLRESSADAQEITVQSTLIYRVSDPERAAARVNFTISLRTGAWTEKPLERLAGLWAQKAQQPARAYITAAPLTEVLRSGAERVREAIESSLRADPTIPAMGLELVSVAVSRVAPAAELEKALQTPTREMIQQKADEAVFQRRAMAVEKERAIKENELATQIELARRQDQLIRQQGANRLLEVQQTAEAERLRIEADWDRDRVAAEAYAQNIATRAEGDAEAKRRHLTAESEAEARRIELWRQAPGHVVLGLTAQQFAQKIQSIQHLNLTPDLLGASLQQFLREQANE
jgi:regulator of protease activity HflC (stomatin/prohibitin superfamily)